jgi:4-hydroxyproline epimerase
MTVDVPGHGPVTGDVAWGGNWFFLMTKHEQRVESNNLAALAAFSLAVQKALEDQGVRGSDGGLIDHIELFADDDQADSRNFVLCPGGAYDRSPCGTGTSAKLACLAAEASYAMEGDQLIPTLRGRAFMSAEATLLIEPNDPFGWGIQL